MYYFHLQTAKHQSDLITFCELPYEYTTLEVLEFPL